MCTIPKSVRSVSARSSEVKFGATSLSTRWPIAKSPIGQESRFSSSKVGRWVNRVRCESRTPEYAKSSDLSLLIFSCQFDRLRVKGGVHQHKCKLFNLHERIVQLQRYTMYATLTGSRDSTRRPMFTSPSIFLKFSPKLHCLP